MNNQKKYTSLEMLLSDDIGSRQAAREVITLYEAEGHTVEHEGQGVWDCLPAVAAYADGLLVMQSVVRQAENVARLAAQD